MKKQFGIYRITMGFAVLCVMVLSSLVLAETSVASEALRGFYLAEQNDFTSGYWERLDSGAYYRISEKQISQDTIALDDQARSIVYDNNEIRLHFTNLNPEAGFKLRFVCLSNSPNRVFTLMADNEVLQEDMALPFGRKSEHVLDLPSSVYRDKNVELRFIKRGGANVVLSSIELWSNKRKALLYLDIDAAGDFAAHINGVVRDFLGETVSEAAVELKLEGTQQLLRCKTDAEGKFSLTVPQRWRGTSEKWINISAVKGKLNGKEILTTLEVFLPRLSPKPHWVSSVEEPVINLNGTWRFNPAPPPESYKHDLNLKDWALIQVPGEWAMQGFKVEEDNAAAYRRQIDIPNDWKDQQVKIRFDAVYSDARIWFNGQKVGSHMGTFTPFEVDVTEAVMPGGTNTLALEVTSESLAEDNTAGHPMVGHQMGGIIRRVSAFALPKLNIASFHVDTTFDNDYRDATLKVLLEIANEGRDDVQNVSVGFRLTEANARASQIGISPAAFKLGDNIKAGEHIYKEIEIPVKQPKQWNAENPNLYFLDCTLEVADNAVQSAQRRFGFRQLEIQGHQVFLNGQLIRLRGLARQDSHPLMGRTVPEEFHRRDMEIMVWANANNLYTCAFSPDEEVLRLADEMGMYMLEEPGTCWVGTGFFSTTEAQLKHLKDKSIKGFHDPRMYAEFLRPVLEMIQRSRSHPSVLTWMIADESIFSPNFQRVLDRVRELDSSRLLHFSYDPGGDIFDLGSYHYPGYKQLAEAAQSKRPVIFDQFCHIYRIRPELMTDPGIRDEWARSFVPYWEATWKTPSVWGGQVFNFTDDVFLMPSGKVLGYGWWGVIDPWRREKPEVWHIKKAYSPVKIADETEPLPVPAPGEPIQIPIENRYDFTNLNELLIEWALGDESGTVQADLAPHSKGTITILPGSKQYEGKTLSLKFFRKGMMVDAYKLSIGRSGITEKAKSKPAGAVQLIDTDETIGIVGDEFKMVFDRRGGQIRQAEVKGKTVLTGGPVLMILPEAKETHTSGYPTPKPTVSPNNETCHDWKVEKVTASQSHDSVEIVVEGRYREADGQYRLHVGGNGTMSIDYQFKTNIEIHARQIGIVLYVPRSCDTLRWKRKAFWSVYPDDHIGRPEGEAKAFRGADFPTVDIRTAPPWPWSLDSNALGTRDFRATRRGIVWASLTDSDGSGIVVRSDGSQQSRAFVDGRRIGIVVSDFYAAGTGDFTHFEFLRKEEFAKPMNAGTELRGTVLIEQPK